MLVIYVTCVSGEGHGKLFSFMLLAAAAMLLAFTQAPKENPKIQFNIPAQKVKSALVKFADHTDLSLIYDVENLGELITNPVDGLYSPTEALDIMLGNTGLIFEKTGAETIAIKKIKPHNKANSD